MEDERYYFQNSDEENNTGNQHTENDSSFTSEYTEPYRETEETEEAAGSAWQPRGDRHMSEDSREYYFFGEKETEGEKSGGKRRPWGAAALFFVTAAVLAGGVFTAVQSLRRERMPLEQTSLPGAASSESGTAQVSENLTGPLDVSEMAARVMPSVVAITGHSVSEVRYMFQAPIQIESESNGSGFIIGQDEERLYIATNYHVVEDTNSLTVCLGTDDEPIVEAEVLGSDPIRDLAVVTVNLADLEQGAADEISIVSLGSSSDLTVGQRAIAIGNALGYGQSVTQGVISALNREVTVDGYTDQYIQTDAAINYGNSGGALLNEAGEVIGINYAKAAEDGVEGMGYAIPIDEAMEILQELMETQEGGETSQELPGYLGISVQELSEEARLLYGIPMGIFVSQVGENGPAQKAGLQQGDVISKIAGYSITDQSDLQELMPYLFQGDTVAVEYYRAVDGVYGEYKAEITLEAQPADEN